MTTPARNPRSATRTFALYAAISLVPVLVLGLVLAVSLRGEAKRRGLAEGRSEAALIAHSAIEPALDGSPIEGRGLSVRQIRDLRRVATTVIHGGDVLRLRIRNLDGDVVFSPDGSGLGPDEDDDEALVAAHGKVVSTLTHLNADSNDTGDAGPATVDTMPSSCICHSIPGSGPWESSSSTCPTRRSAAISLPACTSYTSTSPWGWRRCTWRSSGSPPRSAVAFAGRRR